jgi:hypothetical protein
MFGACFSTTVRVTQKISSPRSSNTRPLGLLSSDYLNRRNASQGCVLQQEDSKNIMDSPNSLSKPNRMEDAEDCLSKKELVSAIFALALGMV